MPNVSGLDMVEKLLENGCKIKNIAFISGSWTDEEYARALDLGCRVFEKPFKLEQIGEWLDQCEKRIKPDRVLTVWA